MRSSWLAALATVAVLLAGCGEDPAAPREGTSAEELTGDVSGTVDLDTHRVGDRISLTGQVVDVLGAGAFTLRPADGATERPVLVLNRHDGVVAGQTVQVAGFVRVLDDDLTTAYEGAADAGQDARRVVEARTVDQNVPGDGD